MAARRHRQNGYSGIVDDLEREREAQGMKSKQLHVGFLAHKQWHGWDARKHSEAIRESGGVT